MPNPFIGPTGFRSPTLEEARAYFWSRVVVGEPDDCWPWTGSHTGRGYGQFQAKGLAFTSGLAHRWAYWFTHGVSPREVSHTCHNPPCVNPNHLTSGTHLENEQHKTVSGRRPTGVKHLPCPHCGGPQDGRSSRSGGRVFAFCIPCRRAYMRAYLAEQRKAAETQV